MPCFNPVRGFRSRTVNPTGKRSIVFNPKEGYSDLPLVLSCGKCIDCRRKKVQHWALRIFHEYKSVGSGCFITLTYNDSFLPKDGNLCIRHFQLFMKRLRKRFARTGIKYFSCGEYGAKYGRPHYHAVVIGVEFSDMRLHSVTNNGPLYVSKSLADLWGMGFVTIADVTGGTANYVAGYVMKKFALPTVDESKVPEYHSASNGLGKSWIKEYYSDVLAHGFVLSSSGRRLSVPRYYKTFLQLHYPELYKDFALRTSMYAKSRAEHDPFRLQAKESCMIATNSRLFNSRSFRDEN